MITARRQQGFSIVTAIFLIVILAALGTYMLRTSSVQSETSALTVQSARAYQAARSGLEWGLNTVLTPLAAPACFAPAAFTLQGFSVDVECTSTDHPEGGQTVRVYEIRATSSFGTLGQPTHVQRVIDIRAFRT